MGAEKAARPVEWQPLGRSRRAGLRSDGRAGEIGRPVHHEPGRRRPPLGARDDAGRSLPRALRADGSAGRQSVQNPKIKGNPVARMFKGDREQLGTADKFPIVATTYRLTEHFHYWTKHVQPNAVMQPEFFIEMSEQLAEEKKHQDRFVGQSDVQPRLRQSQGGRDQAPAADADRRQDGPRHRHPHPLGFHRCRQEGLRRERPRPGGR